MERNRRNRPSGSAGIRKENNVPSSKSIKGFQFVSQAACRVRESRNWFAPSEVSSFLSTLSVSASDVAEWDDLKDQPRDVRRRVAKMARQERKRAGK